MNYGALIFLAAFIGISASWFGFVLTPQIQIGRETQATNTVNTAELYPIARPGLANEGAEVYRANGCVYCHSQQVGQSGTEVNVVLSEVGTNPVAVAEALIKANVGATNVNAAGLSAGLPKTILRNISIGNAKKAAKAARDAGAESRVDVVPVGVDIERGWGVRHSVAQDYIYDHPVMLGSQRVGPDLANVGVRWPNASWHLMHLYAPKAVVPDSVMPSYKFLFEQRKISGQPSPDALRLTGDYAPPAGYEIVPRAEAKALVAYLLSLHAGAPLFEAPLSVVSAPAATAAATNSPAK
jgi:cbb3-type cytochrome oxidase cytochrome c subunit